MESNMAKKTNIPDIRFKGFSEEWKEDILSNLTDILRCGIAATPKYVSEGVIFLSSQNVTSLGKLSMHKYNYITKEYYEKISKNSKLLKGDVLYSRVGAGYGNATIFPFSGDYGVYVSLTHIRTNELLQNTFLKFFLNSPLGKSQADNGVFQGGGVPNLNVKIVERFKISYPLKSEQTKIGNYFKNLDQLITQHQQKYDKLLTIKKAMLKKMFPQNGATVPEIRFKGFTEDWEERTLADVAEISTGYPFDSNCFNDNGDFLVITNGNIQNDFYSVDNSIGNRIDIENNAKLIEYVLNINDILVTMDGTVGRTAKVLEQKQILAQRVGRLTAKLDAEFLYQFFNTGKFFKKMSLISHGGTIKHISLTEIGDYKDFMPKSIEEQKKIGRYFAYIDTITILHQSKLEKLKNIKKAFLDKMFV